MTGSWAIVLAGGSGVRLRELTEDDQGAVTPKQFCSIRGHRSLLQDAIARARSVVAPDRIMVVVAAKHEAWWRDETVDLPADHVLVQPCDRGTAAGVLLPLLAIARRDPDACVLLLPSDHFVGDEPALASEMRRIMALACLPRAPITILGMVPDEADAEYGWIVPVRGHGSIRRVDRFVEKPDGCHAATLLEEGALWSTLVLAARTRTLLALYERHMPGLLASLQRALAGAASRGVLERCYAELAPADFSRGILQGSEDCLAVLAVPPCGWTDLGTPERVARCLAGLGRASPAPVLRATAGRMIDLAWATARLQARRAALELPAGA